MHPWATWKLAEQRRSELGAPRRSHPEHLMTALAGREHVRAAPRLPAVAGRVSVWFGYRMISLGCRLARPALVLDASPRA